MFVHLQSALFASSPGSSILKAEQLGIEFSVDLTHLLYLQQKERSMQENLSNFQFSIQKSFVCHPLPPGFPFVDLDLAVLELVL